MAYDVNSVATLGQLQNGLARAKQYMDGLIAALPEDMVLDQAQTKFVNEFEFDADLYTGAEDPNLEGKPVLVLAVKTDKDTISYSFLNMAKLIDTYEAKDASIVINGREINVKISKEAGNSLVLRDDGIYVPSDEGKLDKVENAVEGNVPAFGADGAVADSGIAAAKILTTDDLATEAEMEAMLAEVFPA